MHSFSGTVLKLIRPQQSATTEDPSKQNEKLREIKTIQCHKMRRIRYIDTTLVDTIRLILRYYL